MRIAYLTSYASRKGGGVSESLRLLANLVATVPDTKVEVFTLDDNHLSEDRQSWRNVSINAFSGKGPAQFGYSLPMLRSVLECDADLVHLHGIWTFQAYIALRWLRKKGKPVIVSPHGMLEPWIMSRSQRKKAVVSKLYQDQLIRKAKTIHVLTEVEKQNVSHLYGSVATAVIPNYVDDSTNDSPGKPSWFMDQYEGRDVYLYLGRIHEKKGCSELLKAWETICVQDEAFSKRSVLVFCGWIDGLPAFPSEVEALASRFFNVIYAGPQYGIEKERSLKAATFFILPSKSEGLPLAILEAWGAGLVVMMTDECNLSESFGKGAAIQVGASSEDLVQNLGSSSRLSPNEREAIRQSGKEYVAERYSKQAVERGFIQIYKSATS